MTKRITSEDCEGNIEDIEDGRYNSHVVPVSAEDDPGYEEIDYGDCTEFTVPLGRYGSHVVPIGGGGGGGAACPNGGLKAGTNIDGKDCLGVNLKQGGAIILDNGQLAIDTSKLKITTDQVYPSGTDTGIVINGPDGESWDTQYDYNQWLYNDQIRQDEEYEDKFVHVIGGDSMEGPLEVTGPRSADLTNGSRLESTIKVLNIDSGENSALHLKHNGSTQVYVGSTQTSFQGDIKFNTGSRAIYSGSDKKGFVINTGGVFYDGAYSDDRHVATKKNVDDVNDSLYQDIIELKEELNAIAPSLEYGNWEFESPRNPTHPPNPGTFYLLNNGALTDQYEEVTGIVIHNEEFVAPGDLDPVDKHTWADANVGDLIQLFDAADPDFFLGRIDAKNVDDVGKYVHLAVESIQTSGTPTDNPDPETKVYLTRVNIFKEPTGGEASDFVLKNGDTMTGNLTINKSADGSTNVESRLTITGSKDNSREAAALIKFINNQTTEPGFLSFRSGDGGTWFTFDQDLDLNNHGLHTVKQIRMQSNGYIGTGAKQLLTFDNDAVNYVGKMDSDTNLVNKTYVDATAGPTVVLIGTSCKWRKGGLPVSSLTGTQYFGIEKAGDTSSQIGYGNVLYLNKLIAIDGTLQPLKNYTPTDGSLIEVWYGNELYFKSLLDPTTYKVADRNPDEIVCDCTTSRPLVSKSGVSWSTSLTYTIILTGMKSNG